MEGSRYFFNFLLYFVINGAFGVATVGIRPPSRDAGQNFDAVFHCDDLIHMKHAGLDGIDDLFFEHQVFDVGPGDHDSLFSGKAFGFAGFKKPFVFWLTPPMAWICSFWLIDPVTAMPWRMGISDRLERMAYSSGDEALSPI